MPNRNNPFDEPNYILPSHNLGFPPPNEKWLPNLFREPPVEPFDPLVLASSLSGAGFALNDLVISR